MTIVVVLGDGAMVTAEQDGTAVPDDAAPHDAVPDPATPSDAVPEPAVPDAAMPSDAVPEPAVPEPAVPESAVPESAVPEPAVPDAAMPAMPCWSAELSADERAELERLRAEVADLRSQVAAAPGVAEPPPVVPPTRPRRQRWRSVVATLLIVIGCVLAPLSVAAVWAKNLVTDTDRYVATVTPLASDPAIQNAVANKITTEIFARLDVQGITNQAVDALAERGLPPRIATQLHALSEPLASGVQSFVRDEVGKFVASDAFKDAWVTANRSSPSGARRRDDRPDWRGNHDCKRHREHQPWPLHSGRQTTTGRQGVRSCESHPRHQPLVHDLAIRSHHQSSGCLPLAQCDSGTGCQ